MMQENTDSQANKAIEKEETVADPNPVEQHEIVVEREEVEKQEITLEPEVVEAQEIIVEPEVVEAQEIIVEPDLVEQQEIVVEPEAVEQPDQIVQLPPPFVITLYVADEGIEECRRLLMAWVPDIPISIVVLSSTPFTFEYLQTHLSTLDTFTTEIVEDTAEVQSQHIYLIGPTQDVELKEYQLEIVRDPKPTATRGTVYFKSLAQSHKERSIVLLFADSIVPFASFIKYLGKQQACILHHTPPRSGFALKRTPAPIQHLVDRSFSLEQAAVYTQRFIESFNEDKVTALQRKPDFLQLIETTMRLLSELSKKSLDHITPEFGAKRIVQRLRILGLTTTTQYNEYLRADKEEVARLVRRIALTPFTLFNDSASMRFLAKAAIPALLKDADTNKTLRIWIPGCSTGENVISASMLVHEYSKSTDLPVKLRLIGTEVDEDILHFARKPLYALDELNNIPAAQRDQYFEEVEGIYEYRSSFLEQCHYSYLPATALPPYANIDLIYCAGVLPSLTPAAREQMLQHFNTALSSEGLLVLADQEVGNRDIPFFAPVKNKELAYKPIQATIPARKKETKISLFKNQAEKVKELKKAQPAPDPDPLKSGLTASLKSNGVKDLHRDFLLLIQAPVSLMIRPDFSIVDHIGDVGRFVSWPNNGKTANLLEAFPDGVREDLKFAVNQVIKSNIALKSRPIRPEFEGILREFRLQVHPIKLDDEANLLIQVIFIESDIPRPLPKPEPSSNDDVEHLEEELRKTKEKLTIVSGLLKDSKELLKKSNARQAESVAQESGSPKSNNEDKLKQQNSELKSTNQELLALNRDLVRRVEELRKNMNRKLEEAKRAHAASAAQNPAPAPAQESRGSFHKSLSLLLPRRHEVRTSLTSIIGFADLLADRIVDKDNIELAKYIGKAGHRLSENLSPLLSLDIADENSGPDMMVEATPEETIAASERVLVVEDSDATRRLLTLVLSDRFDCEVASDASEAIEKAEREIFKAVLLDIDLGKGPTGLDVLDHLRQKNYYRTVPFMAVTSMASPQDRSMLLRKGFDAFIPKPFQKVQLLSTLDKIIENRPAA